MKNMPLANSRTSRAVFAALLFIFGNAPHASAQASSEPHTDLVSGTTTGSTERSAISADGRFVLFSTDDGEFEGENGNLDIFVYDRTRGTTESLPVPDPRLSRFRWEAMSDDARSMVLTAAEQGAVSPVVILYDRQARRARRVGRGGNSQVSADGRWVVFQHFEAENGSDDPSGIYVYERTTQRSERLNLELSQSDWIRVRGISSDGRSVLFESAAPGLVEGDTNQSADVFAYDRAQQATRRVSVNSTGAQADGVSWISSMSDDGRYIAFISAAPNLVAGDTNGVADVFVHDAVTRKTTRVSVAGFGSQVAGQSHEAAISRNGQVVVFALWGPALDPRLPFVSIYAHDRSTGITRPADVDSQGRRKEGGGFAPAISGNGRFVTFATWTSLTADDEDSGLDIYIHDFGTRTPGSRLTTLLEAVAVAEVTYELRQELTALVSGANDAYRRGDRQRACSDMHAFTDGVQAEWNRAIATTSAAALFNSSERLAQELGCPPSNSEVYTFSRSRFPAPSAWWFGLAVGDFNGDGHLDAAGTHSGSLSVRAGDGYASFSAPVLVDAAPAPRGLIAADVNHDGLDDLVVANQDSQSASVFIARRGGLSFSRVDLAAGQGSIGVAAGDFTGDGIVDIAIANNGEDFVTLYRGRARGGWSRLPDLHIGYGAFTIAIIDVNNDGCGDLVTSGDGAVALALCVKSGQPAFAGYPAYGNFGKIARSDFNSDGLIDIAVTDYLSPGVRLLTNTGGGWLNDAGVIDIPAFFVAAGDVTGDGRADIVATSFAPSGVWVVQGNGDGTFGRRQWIERDYGASEIAVADMNHDRALDVLVLATTARTPSEAGKPSMNVLVNAPLVHITTPNTAEHWGIGSVRRIEWRHRLSRGTAFRIDASRDDGATWSTVGSTRATGSTTRFSWKVAGPESTQLRFRVSGAGDTRAADLNDSPITIAAPALSLEGLNAVQWGLGTTQTIRWSHNLGARVPVAIDLSRNGGATWESLASRVETTGSEASTWKWTVTGPATPEAVLRVRSLDGLAGGELRSITLAPPFVRLQPLRPTTPWNACEPRQLRWTSNLGRSEAVHLQASADGQSWVTQLESFSGSVGSWRLSISLSCTSVSSGRRTPPFSLRSALSPLPTRRSRTGVTTASSSHDTSASARA